MSTRISEIERIVKHNPTELKYLFKSPTEDKRRLTRLISHMVPYRVGIEFETFGSVGNHLYPYECLLAEMMNSTSGLNDKVCKRLKLVAFREDNHLYGSESHLSYDSELINPIDHNITTDGEEEEELELDPSREEEPVPTRLIDNTGKLDLNEVRISISGYKQLVILWNTLGLLKRYLTIPKINGGIHIHVDAQFAGNSDGRKFAVNWFHQSDIQSEVLQIFNGYDGTYNRRGASANKGCYVRVSTYPTVEFRIGRLTYDYSTLIRYIIKCSDLVRRCKTAYYNKKKYIIEASIPHESDEIELSYDTNINDQVRSIQITIEDLDEYISVTNVGIRNDDHGIWYRTDNESLTSYLYHS